MTRSSKKPLSTRESFAKYCCFQQIYILILGFALILCLLGGAYVFSKLERPSEIERNEIIAFAKSNHTEQIDKVIMMLVNSSSMTMDEAMEIIDNFTMSAVMNSVEETANWKFGSSLFFALTVVTTIGKNIVCLLFIIIIVIVVVFYQGYGNTAPTTPIGQGFFIIYAIICIPIALAFLSFFGQLLKNITDLIVGKILHIIFSKDWTDSKLHLLSAKVTAFIFFGFVLFVLFPALAFRSIQGWSYFESFYYCIVTLTTVGFGDFVPGIPSNSLDGFYRVCVGCWIFIGLSYLLLITNLLQEMLQKFTAVCGRNLCTKGKNKDAVADIVDVLAQADAAQETALNK